MDEMDGRFDKLVKSGAYRFRCEISSDQLRHIYRADNPPVLNLDWGAMVGDCVHNLRTALDHLAWQLVRANGTDRPPNTAKFPIFSSPPSRRRRWFPWIRKSVPLRIAGGVHPDALRLIEDVQPYKGGDESKHFLHIRELDNFDKHRDLVVVAGAIHTAHTGGALEEDGTIRGNIGTKFTGLPIKDNEVVAILYHNRPQPDPDPNLGFGPYVVLQGEPMPGEILGKGLLPQLVNFIEKDFVPRFVRFFPT